jgi:hypothetical protein
MKTALIIFIWIIGLLTGFFLFPLVYSTCEHEEYILENLFSTAGEFVDVKPFGAHFIACGECGFTYRFFYSCPGPWKAALNHDPVATELMREMMELEKINPGEEPENGPPEADEPELEL